MRKRIQRILAQYSPRTVSGPNLIPASVLLLTYPKDREYHILFTKRTDRVEHHKGEISFPGGAWDDGDGSPLATALREAQEEMGILPQDVVVLGALDQVRTLFDYQVSPFVGTIPYPYPFVPNRGEIDQVLEVPLSTLLATEERSRETAWGGVPYLATTYRFGGHVIFGATARVVKQFLDLCWRSSGLHQGERD